MTRVSLAQARLSGMPARGGVLHFDSNAGDRIASPLTHYFEYFSRFRLRRHDIRYVNFEMIHPEDVVIIGGGGIFDYAEFINRTVNRLLDTGAAVIGWAPGFNTHREYQRSFDTTVDYDRFHLLAVRDYENSQGIAYLPDVTCKLPQLQQQFQVRREFGIARHKDFPLSIPGIESIDNSGDIDEIIQFLGETEVVIANSYHMTYWATLLGKKCLNPAGFSSKFESFEHPPTFFDPAVDDLADVATKARTYDVLDAAVAQTDDFFTKVKAIVEGRLSVSTDKADTYLLATESATFYQRARESMLSFGDMVASRLLIDSGDGFHSHDSITTVSNVFGDELLTAHFDLTEFDNVQQVSFHPVDGHACKVEIVSATSDSHAVELTPEGAVRVHGFDSFLTTDPRYLSASPVGTTLEIAFRLELLPKAEIERTILNEAGLVALRTAERDHFKAEFSMTYDHLMGTAAELETLKNSFSWRVTAPVRSLQRRLQGRRQK